MRITTIGKRGASHLTTIPPEILRALGAHAGDYISWIWNTAGHIEVHRVLRAGESAAPRARSK